MLPVPFLGHNKILKGPGCFDLPVQIQSLEAGQCSLTSHWKMSQSEIDVVKRTGIVSVTLQSRQHPPISVRLPNYEQSDKETRQDIHRMVAQWFMSNIPPDKMPTEQVYELADTISTQVMGTLVNIKAKALS